MAGGIPEIGVRLTAQGVQDVVTAFQRVRAEAHGVHEGAEEASAGMEHLKTQFESLTELVPLLTLGLFVEKIVEAGKEALEMADQIGKLSERTGASVGTLSVLAKITNDVGLQFDQLSGGITKLAKAQDQAASGSAKQKKAFTDLGITLNDLKTKDPGEIFKLAAERLERLGPSAHKVNTEMVLFGKSGAELDPVLHKVAEGFQEAEEHAKKLGLYLDEEGAQAAIRASEALKEIGDVAKGLATQFQLGFAPRMAQALDGFAESVQGKGVNSMRTFGDVAGKTVQFFLAGITVLTAGAENLFRKFSIGAKNVFGEVKAEYEGLKDGGIKGAIIAGQIYKGEHKAETEAAFKASDAKLDAQLDAAREAFNRPLKAPKSEHHGSGGADPNATGISKEEAAKQLAAQSALEQSLADNRLAIQKALNAAAEAEDKRHYDAGLLTTDAYYDAVEQRVRADAAAQFGALEAKYKGASTLPGATPEEQAKRAEAQAKIQAQITELFIKQESDLEAAEGARAAAHLANGTKELEITKQLSKASGDKFAAEEAQLEITLKEYDQLLKKEENLTEAQRAARLAAVSGPARARIDFGRSQQAGTEGLAGLNEDVRGIQDQAGNGSISQVAATAQIIRLEERRLVDLRDIGAQMARNAVLSGDPALVAAARKYNAELDTMSAKLHNVTTAETYLSNFLKNDGHQALEDFFAEGISGAKGFGGAIDDLATTVEQAVGRMVAKLLVFYALEALLGLVAPKSDYLKDLKSAGPFGSFDRGGFTGGRVGVPAGIVHGEEWVATAEQTRRYGPLFKAIGEGSALPAIAPVTSSTQTTQYTQSLAQGESSQPLVQVITPPGASVQQKTAPGPGGTRIQQIIISAVHEDIASGGKVAKQIEGQYGLNRGGVRRA